jgi:hypothetical protein
MLGGNQNPDAISTFHPRQRPTQIGDFSQINNTVAFRSHHSRQSAFRGGSDSSQGPIVQFPFAKTATTMKAYGQDNSTPEEWIDEVATHDNVVERLGFEEFGSHKGIKKTVEFELREYCAGGDKESMSTEHDFS